MRVLIGVILFLFSFTSVIAQSQDSMQQVRNKALLKKMERAAKKTANGFNKLSFNDKRGVSELSGTKRYLKYKGKTIRYINITILRPFGVDIGDTSIEVKINKFQKRANKFHILTRNWVVRNDLFFKEGQKLDPQRIADSEQQLWDRNTFKMLHISITPVKDSSRYVDVNILLQDRFTFNFITAFEFTRLRASLNLINFAGAPQTITLGGQLSILPNNWFSFFGSYSYDNIASSHISASVKAAYERRGVSAEVAIKRNFFSAETKWGGAAKGGFVNNLILTVNDTIQFYRPVQNYQDVCFVFAFKKRDTSSVDGDKLKVLVGARYQRQQFTSRPFRLRPDGAFRYTYNTRLLLSVGVASWNSYNETFVYYLGQKEYIPKGISAQLIGGVEQDELWGKRVYLGMHAQYGIYNPKFGYTLFDISYGGYNTSAKYEQIHTAAQLRYYTPLFKIGKWRIRQFVSAFLYLGYLRPPGSGFQMVDKYGLKGLNFPVLRGERNASINLETSFYLPKKILGFTGSIFLNIDLVYMGYQKWETQFNIPIQQSYGAGIRLRHPNIGLNNIEVGLYYYPVISKYNIFPINAAGGTRNARQAEVNNLYNLDAIHTDY